MNKYEVVLVLNPDLDDNGVREQVEKVGAIAGAHGGSIERQELWGRRQLAYRINKREWGFYVVLILDGDRALVADLDRQLKINESVLRHLVVCKDKHAPDSAPHLKEGGEAPEFPVVAVRADDFDDDDDGASVRA